ncbi:MAG: VWA domain-containing protein [Ruminococcus sp.]
MGINSSNKTISTNHIDCDGTLKVVLSLTASPNITENPTDIVLVLDRSGSMAGKPLANMKSGAKKFIDIIDEATDGTADGNIGGGSHIGIVSFSDTATQNTQLITSVEELKTAVDSLTAGGRTNHADAFTKADALFDKQSTNQKIIVMFTDGNTTAGPPPTPVAESTKASGVIIYCIGLVGESGLNEDMLNDWATDPDDSHVLITPDDQQLEDLFEELAKNISKPGATNIVIDEIINDDFKIISTQQPTKGTVSMLNSTTLQWKIDSLGKTANEGASLEFTIQHIASTPGTKKVNESITYKDSEGNKVVFPDPAVEVTCGIIIKPERCPEPRELVIGGCEDSVVFEAEDLFLESLGRIAQIDVRIKNVCPGRRVALAVVLNEVDDKGIEHQRGLKTITVPAHSAPSCRDVLVKCIKFVLPEDLDVSGDSEHAICNRRKFKARMFAHYIDNDFFCCDAVL